MHYHLLLLLLLPAPTTPLSTLTRTLLNAFKSSPLLSTLHTQHISSPIATHLFKSTPLVRASNQEKLTFATSTVGRVVSEVMRKEMEYLGDWKIEKIVEAAGVDFDENDSFERLLGILQHGYNNNNNAAADDDNTTTKTTTTAPRVTLFSFQDCPWCLLAKQLLHTYNIPPSHLQILELEHLGIEGKHLRASIALSTGRTSMPACFIGGKSVGGYTDGFFGMENNKMEGFTFVPRKERDLRMVGSEGLESLHLSGELKRLLEGV